MIYIINKGQADEREVEADDWVRRGEFFHFLKSKKKVLTVRTDMTETIEVK